MPTATAIRDSLPQHETLQALSIGQRKAAAEEGLKAILAGIRDGSIPLGDWEKISIENAVLMIARGLYGAAINELVCAIWPVHDRSPKLNISARTAARTLEEFERELDRLMRLDETAPEKTTES